MGQSDDIPTVCSNALFAVESIAEARRISRFEAMGLEFGIWPLCAENDRRPIVPVFCLATESTDPEVMARGDEPDVCRSARDLVHDLRIAGRISTYESSGILAGIWPREPRTSAIAPALPILRVLSPTLLSGLPAYAARRGGHSAHD